MVVEVASAHPEHRQENACLALGCDELHQRAVIGGADVEVAVGGEQDSVDAPLDERLFRELVGEVNALAAVGAAARFELVQRLLDLSMVGA